MKDKIAFIGAGKMAEALIACLDNVIVADVNKKRLKMLKKKYQLQIAGDNQAAFAAAKIVILAVKPQNISSVVAELALPAKQALQLRNRLIISIAAGIPLKYLEKKLPGIPVVRAMPNNPCLVGEGMTALAKGKLVNNIMFMKAAEIFAQVGDVALVPEKWLDAVTGLSGSGPAFIYEAIEALAAGGVKAGLKKDLATKLAVQTVLGSALTVKQSGKAPRDLQAMVTSPGGTTVEGLKALKKFNFSRALSAAVLAAAKKSKQLESRWTL